MLSTYRGRRLASVAAAFLATMCSLSNPQALELNYIGETTFCSSVCNAFGALGGESGSSNNITNSTVTGVIDVPVDANGNFSIAPEDNVFFDLQISTTAIPFEDPVFWPAGGNCPPPDMPGQLCNPATVNPLPVSTMQATVQGSGQLGEDGRPISGELDIVFTSAPFSNNGAVITFSLDDGSFVGTVFGEVVVFTRGEGRINDDDNDSVGNALDNCLEQINPAQRDSDADGYGNRCDADLNNDCVVASIDLGILRSTFFTSFENADLDGDGSVNFIDLGIFRSLFFNPPGPSADNSFCAP